MIRTTTAPASSRWTAMLDAGTGMKSGDYLFIQFGINDGDSACPRHVGTARYRELLGVMAQAATTTPTSKRPAPSRSPA